MEETLESPALFYVRNMISKNGYMRNFSAKEIIELASKFRDFNAAFDTSALISNFIYSAEKKLVCVVCKKEFISQIEVFEELECSGQLYHPKHAMKGDKTCSHESCQKKCTKLEHPCCHQPFGSKGCLPNDKKHVIVIQDGNEF